MGKPVIAWASKLFDAGHLEMDGEEKPIVIRKYWLGVE